MKSIIFLVLLIGLTSVISKSKTKGFDCAALVHNLNGDKKIWKLNYNEDEEIEGEWELRDSWKHSLKDVKIYGRGCSCSVDVIGENDLEKNYILNSMDSINLESENFDSVVGGNVEQTNVSRNAIKVEFECDKN
mmetsp:Transcript_5781/g.5965  ORF Transcript_5781/g.5965 Transcript_5781/m.5965 type:complete len:134 (+) Transcript_5781:87-488(+)